MRLGHVCTRTISGATLVLSVACSAPPGGQDQFKGTDAGAGFVCPQEGNGAVTCADAAAQLDAASRDMLQETGSETGDDASDDGSTSGGS